MLLEAITEHLTPAEANLVPSFVNALKSKQGRSKAVAIEVMQGAIISLEAYQVLKIIHHIRIKGLVPMLVHDEKGYWVAQSRAEVEEAVKRIRSIEDMCWKERNSLQQQMEVSWLK